MVAMALAVPVAAGAATGAATLAKKPAAKPAAAAAAVVEPQPNADILMGQARDAQDRGERDLAVRLAQSAIVAAPARPAPYDALADIYLAQNQPEAARSYYAEALSIDPADPGAQRGMATLDHGAPQQQAAQQIFRADDQGKKTATP
jgi:tetratricopeptide (TPR) repeat protein